ncbi:MAG TPA: phage tail protein [Cytophagaceae bacterium]|jgi:phage tail-like protein|nr:phage tail protein [Cytophagaceae bacterium]HSZ31912.1 phage tail protein [Puia sp.]
MGKSNLYYPPVGFHFDVRILGVSDAVEMVTAASGVTPNIEGKFSEVSGLSFELKKEPYIEGGENRFTYQLPTNIEYAPLILKRGLVSSSSALWIWVQDTMAMGLSSPVEIKNIMVTLLSDENAPLMGWLFINAYPTKWQVSDMNAMQNEIMVESVEFAYHRFEKFNL